MRRHFIFSLLVLLLPALASAQPAIVFEAESHDFGALAAGATAEHAFEFVNTGNEDLVIQKLVTS